MPTSATTTGGCASASATPATSAGCWATCSTTSIEADRDWLDPVLAAVAEQAPLLVAGDASAFMSKVALALTPPRPKEPKPGRLADEAARPDKRTINGSQDQGDG